MIIPNIWENKKCSKPPTSDNIGTGRVMWMKQNGYQYWTTGWWLGQPPLWKMMEFGNWDDLKFPILMGKCQIDGNQTTNQYQYVIPVCYDYLNIRIGFVGKVWTLETQGRFYHRRFGARFPVKICFQDPSLWLEIPKCLDNPLIFGNDIIQIW